MKRTLFAISLLLFTLSLKAQPYNSMFGQNSTTWTFMWGNLFGAVNDMAYAEKDTLINNVSYKKIKTQKSAFSGYEGGLLREDSTTGKVWYRELRIYFSPDDTVDQLIFDFSLQPGDTFVMEQTLQGPNVDTVDSVKTINGLKYIYFNSKLPNTEAMTFIEGIGSNAGILFRSNAPDLMVAHYLLCSYKDEHKTEYINKRYNGNCNPVSISTPFKENIQISLYPNPAADILHIENKSGIFINAIRLVAVDGRIISEVLAKNIKELSLKNVPSGYYFIHLLFENQQTLSRPLVVQQ